MTIDAVTSVGLALLISHILNYQSDSGIYKAVLHLTFPSDFKRSFIVRTPSDIQQLFSLRLYERSLITFVHIGMFFRYFTVPILCFSSVSYIAGLVALAIDRLDGIIIINENISTSWNSTLLFLLGMFGIFMHIFGMVILKVPALIERLPGFEEATSLTIVTGRARKKSDRST